MSVGHWIRIQICKRGVREGIWNSKTKSGSWITYECPLAAGLVGYGLTPASPGSSSLAAEHTARRNYQGRTDTEKYTQHSWRTPAGFAQHEIALLGLASCTTSRTELPAEQGFPSLPRSTLNGVFRPRFRAPHPAASNRRKTQWIVAARRG